KEMGEDAPQSILLNLHLAEMVKRSDKPACEKYLEKALKAAESNFGSDDPQVAKVLEPYETLAESQKQWDKATKMSKRIIDIYDRELEASNLRAAVARDKYGDLCFLHGKAANAETPYRDAIKNYSRTMGPESLMVAV